MNNAFWHPTRQPYTEDNSAKLSFLAISNIEKEDDQTLLRIVPRMKWSTTAAAIAIKIEFPKNFRGYGTP